MTRSTNFIAPAEAQKHELITWVDRLLCHRYHRGSFSFRGHDGGSFSPRGIRARDHQEGSLLFLRIAESDAVKLLGTLQHVSRVWCWFRNIRVGCRIPGVDFVVLTNEF
jgi:hypothetical protein